MTEITQIIQEIKLSTDYQVNKRILKEKIDTELHVPHNNGLFKVSMELITFLTIWNQDQLFLEDVYENPIRVDREKLLSDSIERYNAVMNDWYIQHESLKRIRKI